ncbi:MAG: hypothetical protein NT099_00975 [Candidatus Saganbacteria bacterium]|nr:hypothetical protein [Candidatus Saganbacteria bacterium]
MGYIYRTTGNSAKVFDTGCGVKFGINANSAPEKHPLANKCYQLEATLYAMAEQLLREACLSQRERVPLQTPTITIVDVGVLPSEQGWGMVAWGGDEDKSEMMLQAY